MLTIADIAKEADVSLSTVSRVINQSVSVSEEKRARVLAAMEKLGYQQTPKPPRSTACADKHILAFIGFYDMDLCCAAQQTALRLGYRISFTMKPDTKAEWQEILSQLRQLPENTYQGILLFSTPIKDETFHDILDAHPVVQVGAALALSENYLVNIDDIQAAYDLTKHLIGLGKKRIAFVTLENTYPNNSGVRSFVIDREYGFRKAMRENGLKIHENMIISTDYSPDDGAWAAQKLLQLPERPDAVVCISDLQAYGCLSVFAAKGVRVPEEIAVCGFDDLAFSQYCYPPLTTINQNFSAMGAAAMQMLHSLIQKEITTGRKLYIQHELVKRASTIGAGGTTA